MTIQFQAILFGFVAIAAVGMAVYSYYTESQQRHQPHGYSQSTPRPPPYQSPPDSPSPKPKNGTEPNKRRNTKKTDRCTICLADLEQNSKTSTLDCSHQFHKHCIDMWFTKNKSCPLCRSHYN